jgi:hypothetical protein
MSMSDRSRAALAFICLSFICPVRANDDALPIIERAFEAARANEVIARRYVFHERIEERRLNKKGEEKKRESHTYDVTLLDTSEYRRLIAINDRPLYKETASKEQRKLDKQIKKMQNETPKQRAKRLAKVEKGRAEGEEFLEEITKAFDFRLTGEEEIDGVATYVISAEPKEGYKPSSREGKVLTRLHGTLWISRDDHAWVRADLETTANIRWAVIFKLRKGAKIQFTQRRLNDEVWVPDSWYVRLRAVVALVFKFNGEVIGSYSNYRRFTTDSSVIHTEATR